MKNFLPALFCIIFSNLPGQDLKGKTTDEMFSAKPSSATIVLQPDGLCGKDAQLASCIPCGYNTTNYGSSPELNAIAWTNGGAPSNARSLLQFDLTSIPAGSVVLSAYLSMFFDPLSSNGQHSSLSGPNDAWLNKVAAPWNETTVTWDNQPPVSIVSQVYFPPSISPTQDYLNMNVTAMIQDFVNNPSLNYGMMLQLVTESYYRSLIFASSDHLNPNLHPRLEVTFDSSTVNCPSLKFASCNGTDAVVLSCVPCGYDTMNSGNSSEVSAIAWTNGGNLSNSRSLLYWDLSFIPANATVTSALFSLYAYNSPSNGEHSNLSGPNNAYLNKITSPWSEYTVNWNNMPAVSPLNQAYLPASISPTQDYLNTDVTLMVQDMVTNPASNYGMMLQLVTESYYRRLIFASSDNADPAKHPKLEICYTVPVSVAEVQTGNSVSVTQDFISGNLMVQAPGGFEAGTMLEVFNSHGQKVCGYDKLRGTDFILKTIHLTRGIYYYRLISKTATLTGKLISK